MPSLEDDPAFNEIHRDHTLLRKLHTGVAEARLAIEQSCAVLAESTALLEFADRLDGALIDRKERSRDWPSQGDRSTRHIRGTDNVSPS
jgi:hypothetical protein